MTEADPGARVQAGADDCERLARALDLPDPSLLGPSWRWRRLGGHGSERLRLTAGDGVRELTFCLLAGSDGGAFVRTARLRLIYEGRTIGAPAERFLRAVAGALGDRDLDTVMATLVAMVGEQPALEGHDVLYEPGAEEAAAGDASSAVWWSCFTDRDWFFEPTDPVYVSSRHVLLEHGDRECWHSHPWPEPGKLNYYNHPWLVLPHRHRSEPRPPLRLLVSEIGESEVVLGSLAALTSLSQAAVRMADEVDVYLVNHLCTPEVIGDDLDALGHRIEHESGRPVIHMTRESKELGQTVEPLFERARCAVGFFEQPLEPGTVNLIGFPIAYRREELVPFLATLGVRPNVEIVPDLDFDSLTRVLRAPLSVVCRELTSVDAVAQLTAGAGHRLVEVAVPFGWQRSVDALQQVAAAFEREGGLDAWLEEHIDPTRTRFERLRREAAGHRLALVMGAEQLAAMLASGAERVPLLEVIGEMGFGLDLLLFGRQRPELPGGLGDVQTHLFATQAELRELFVTGGAAAVYSDTYFDWRLTSAGKAQFSLRHFEMGTAGALRTLENLLAVCRLPFYRRYGQRLPDRGWA